MNNWITFIIIILLLSSLSCENQITFVWEVNVLTDSNQYAYPTPVVVTVRNNSQNSVDILYCNNVPYYSLQKRVGADWVSIFARICSVEMTYRMLPAGESTRFIVHVTIFEDVDEIAGTYRIEGIIYPSEDRNVRLPERMRISNSFIITYP